MMTCGLKLTHDSAIAVFNGTRLETCIELEKVNNNNRFKIIDCISDVGSILRQNGFDPDDIDCLVIDGWVKDIQLNYRNKEKVLKVAPYHEANLSEDVLKKYDFTETIGDTETRYESYTHVAGHIISAYFTSEFHKRRESSYILIWDGGMYPRIYYYDASKDRITNRGPLFFIGVNVYSIFAQYFGPFKINENVIKDELSIAGKVMAYIAYGKVNDQIVNDLYQTYENSKTHAKEVTLIPQYPHILASNFKRIARNKKYSDEDVLASFHFFLGKILITALEQFRGNNLCIAGGSGLNIKWNSLIRSSKLFNEIWIPPFPNDSGSAIGTALCSLYNKRLLKDNPVDWCVYSGPQLIMTEPIPGWHKKDFSLRDLAHLLFQEKEPIVFLNGRAELGPRALGNRSILASPTSRKMKDTLNYIKLREYYRPISPICLEEHASSIFEPGSPDRYMLFEHFVKDGWQDRIGSVLHVDNSARLQTVNQDSNAVLYTLLKEFYKISGVPVLCNTSANYKGCGFFPDIESAMKWGQVRYIWSNNYLYYKNGSE